MTLTTYSIRRRLLLLLGLPISLATLAQAGVAYRVALHEVGDIADYHMIQVAYAVRRGMPEPAVPSRESSPIDGEDRGFTLQVMPLAANEVDAFPQSESGFSTRKIGKRTFRVYTLDTQSRRIEVMHDEAVLSSMAGKLALRTVLPVLILGPVLLLILWWGIARALLPLATSRDEIARRDANDLHALRTQKVPQELLPFILEINVLFARVSKAFAAQQNFVADAAHELRSPLAALRLQVQSLQRATTAEARDIATTRVMTGINRATRLIEQMLVLAREGASEPENTPTVLPQVVRLALSDVLTQAYARSIDIGADISDAEPEEAFSIHGNGEALRILLRNVLENAVKYTPQQGIVNLSLKREPAGIVLSVEDSGPGIPAEERVQVFERFRRSAGNEIGGSGLGLSIVLAIADRHRILIALDQSVQLGGLAVRLTFPV